MTTDKQLAAGAREIALTAAEAIMRIYAGGFAVRVKDDASPVTEADETAEAIIVDGLRGLTPAIPVVAEEMAAAGPVPDVGARDFWLVDPLDGTREFISRNGEFTVNIALIRGGAPALGVVVAPAKGWTFTAYGPGDVTREADGGPAEPIAARAAGPDGAVVMVSRSHRSPETEDWLAGVKVAETRDAGSSLKFCLLAAGEADLYPRLGRTMEWDTAAGQAVLVNAGGAVERLDDGTPLAYGKPGFENPHFVARGRTAGA